MGERTYDLGDGGRLSPASESIDEALTRLARQDARMGADGAIIPSSTTESAVPPSAATAPSAAALAAMQARLTGPVRRTPPPSASRRPVPPSYSPMPTPTTPTRGSGVATIVRWLIILGLTWFFVRFFLR